MELCIVFVTVITLYSINTDRDNVFNNKDITIDLSIDLNGEYEQISYTLDESTSAFHNWVKMNAPQYPTQNQIQELKEKSRPRKENGIINCFKMNETLNPNEVKMFLLKKQGE